MFKAYFDRSELGSPADVLAVSGYLSFDEKWSEFEPAWQRVLGDFGVETFHMTDFECRRRSFENWDQERRTALPWSGDRPDRESRVRRDWRGDGESRLQRILRRGSDSPWASYAICALKAVADTLRWVDQRVERAVATGEWEVTEIGKRVPVEFVFEEGDEGAGELADQLRKEQESGIFAGRIRTSEVRRQGGGGFAGRGLRGVRDDEATGANHWS